MANCRQCNTPDARWSVRLREPRGHIYTYAVCNRICGTTLCYDLARYWNSEGVIFHEDRTWEQETTPPPFNLPLD